MGLFKRQDADDAPATELNGECVIPIMEQLDAIEPPAARYHISESLTFGITTYTVERWFKRPAPGPPFSYSLGVESGYEKLASTFPTREAAERWLDSYINPEKYRTSYDANGNRIEVGE